MIRLAYDLGVPPSMLSAAIPLSLLSLMVGGVIVVIALIGGAK